MIDILSNYNLKSHNTFGIAINASFFCNYQSPSDINDLLSEGLLAHNEILILGGGSNQLFTQNFKGLVIHPVNETIELVSETNEAVFIKAGAGCKWDNFVAYAVNHGWGGVENLSDIPGNVGAAPVQNIGAYGVEAKDVIQQVHLVDLNDGSLKTIENSECKFDYRFSIFKAEYKGKYLVDSVTFKLTKKPVFQLQYGSLSQEIESLGQVTLQGIRDTIIRIRQSKLPDPKVIGNAGSFFKNPLIGKEQADDLKNIFPDLVSYPVDDHSTKIAAGWLIDKCGLKGYVSENGTAGVHDKQALVLVNKGNATGKDLVDLANFVKEQVYEKFFIQLEPEVIFI